MRHFLTKLSWFCLFHFKSFICYWLQNVEGEKQTRKKKKNQNCSRFFLSLFRAVLKTHFSTTFNNYNASLLITVGQLTFLCTFFVWFWWPFQRFFPATAFLFITFGTISNGNTRVLFNWNNFIGTKISFFFIWDYFFFMKRWILARKLIAKMRHYSMNQSL